MTLYLYGSAALCIITQATTCTFFPIYKVSFSSICSQTNTTTTEAREITEGSCSGKAENAISYPQEQCC